MEDTSRADGAKMMDSEKMAALEKSRADMDAACIQMAEANQQVKDCCDEFEAMLDDPHKTMPEIQKAHSAARNAGIASMGLTTKYLTALNTYMQARGA